MSASSSARTVYFLGLEMPYELRIALRTMPTLESIEPILEAVLAEIMDRPEAAEASKRLQRSLSLDSATLGALFTGVHWLVRTCMRSSLKPKALAAELADCKVHAPFVEPLLQTVEQGRSLKAAGQGSKGASLPTLDSLRWRLDVTISTSSLHRVLRPQLTMQCALSDGSEHAFHISKQRFNELRYTAAKLLKDMEDVEARMPSMA